MYLFSAFASQVYLQYVNGEFPMYAVLPQQSSALFAYVLYFTHLTLHTYSGNCTCNAVHLSDSVQEP